MTQDNDGRKNMNIMLERYLVTAQMDLEASIIKSFTAGSCDGKGVQWERTSLY